MIINFVIFAKFYPYKLSGIFGAQPKASLRIPRFYSLIQRVTLRQIETHFSKVVS